MSQSIISKQITSFSFHLLVSVDIFGLGVTKYCWKYCLQRLIIQLIFFLSQVVTQISQTWLSMELSYEDHYQTSVPLLKCEEELIETLEDHQVNV